MNFYFLSSLLPHFSFVSFAKTSLTLALSLPLGSAFLLPLLTLLLVRIINLLCFAVAIGHCFAIGDSFTSLLGRGRFSPVSVVVKVGKEDDEGDGVTNQSPLHPGREWASTVERVAGVANGHMELDLKLQKCE